MGKIGFFDSGFGGLAIMRDVVKKLPQYNYIYLGDTARGPYGPLNRLDVRRYAEQAVEFLFEQGCELIILACNTATCQALRFIQQERLPQIDPAKRVLGVIVPAAEVAVELTKNQRVGVMATDGTVESGSFVEELQKLRSDITVVQQACPGLVPLIEAGEHHSPMLRAALYEYINPLKSAGIDTLILGCTHYGLIADDIAEAAGNDIQILSEGPIVAEKLADYLGRHPEIEARLAKTSGRTFFSTRIDDFNRHASEFYGSSVRASYIELT
ncbi:MAG: glutamate racemase [Candidatus Saccharimonadales bacterium]